MGMGMGMGSYSPFYGPGYGPFYGPGFGPGYGPVTMGGTYPGFYGGMYGPGFTGAMPSDDEIREMVEESIDADPAVPYDSDINVDVTGGIVTLTGTVPSKRIKHAVGDDAWWVTGVWDVNNNLQVTGRRERMAGAPREREQPRAPRGGQPQRRPGGRRGMQGPTYGRPYGQY